MVRVSIEEAYEILGVGKLSNIEEVKNAYRRLALQTHPDRNKDDPVAHQKFLKVSEAFRRIIDPDVLEICVQAEVVDDEELEGEAGDSEDGDYEYEDGDEYEEEDYEAMFAFRMFEKMFAYGGGAGADGGSPSGGGKEKRSACTCWECRNSRSFFLPKPPSKYIPKSQRPKDPELEAKKAAAAPAANPHENWLSDDDMGAAGGGGGGGGKKKSKKAGAKKKNKKEKAKEKEPKSTQETSSGRTLPSTTAAVSSTTKATQNGKSNKGMTVAAAKAPSSSSESDSESDSSSGSDEDEKEDFISVEEMAKRLNIKTAAPKAAPKAAAPRPTAPIAAMETSNGTFAGSNDLNGFIPAKPVKEVKSAAVNAAVPATTNQTAGGYKFAPNGFVQAKAPAWVVQAQQKAAAQNTSIPQVSKVSNAMHVEDKRVKAPAAIAPAFKAAQPPVQTAPAKPVHPAPAPVPVKKEAVVPPRSNGVPTNATGKSNGNDMFDIPPLVNLPQTSIPDDEDMPPLHPVGDFGIPLNKPRNGPPPGLDTLSQSRVARLDSEPPGLPQASFGGSTWGNLNNSSMFGSVPLSGGQHHSMEYNGLLGSGSLENSGMPTLLSSLRSGSPELNTLNMPLGQLDSNFGTLESSLLQSLERNTHSVDDQFSLMMGGFLNSFDLSLDPLSSKTDGLFSSRLLQDQFTPSSITSIDALLDANEDVVEKAPVSAPQNSVAKPQPAVFSYASAVGASASASAVPSAESKLSNEDAIPRPPADSSPPAMITIGPSTSSYQRAYKVKKCVYFFSPRGCVRGEQCTFLHEDPEATANSSQVPKPTQGYGKR